MSQSPKPPPGPPHAPPPAPLAPPTPLDARLRDATEADLPAIVEIYNSTIPARLATANTTPVTIESRRPWFHAHNPRTRPLWVVELGNNDGFRGTGCQPVENRPRSFEPENRDWVEWHGRPAHGFGDLGVRTDLCAKNHGRDARATQPGNRGFQVEGSETRAGSPCHDKTARPFQVETPPAASAPTTSALVPNTPAASAPLIAAWLSLNTFLSGREAYAATAEVSIYIAEKHRRAGLGAWLLSEALARAPACGVTTLVANIFAHNAPSLRLFKNHGFETWGHLPRVAMLDGTPRDLVILGKHLA